MGVRAILWGAVVVALLAPSVRADEGDSILGLWMTEGGKSRVKVSKRVESVKSDEGSKKEVRYDARIVQVMRPNYGPEDPEAGKPRRDRDNPDESKRDRPLVCLRVAANFTYAGERVWKNGRVYDPESGRTYKGQMTLKRPEPPEDPSQPAPPEELHLRGYVGIPALGRTTVWTRYKEPETTPAE